MWKPLPALNSDPTANATRVDKFLVKKYLPDFSSFQGSLSAYQDSQVTFPEAAQQKKS